MRIRLLVAAGLIALVGVVASPGVAYAQAEADAAEIRTRAQEDIRLATDRAQADLQGRVADLSIELAEKIVERNLDRDTQLALVESYIGQVGNGSRGNGGR